MSKQEQKTYRWGYFPLLPPYQTFKPVFYMANGSRLKADHLSLDQFTNLEYEGQHGAYHYLKADNCPLIICTIVFLKQPTKIFYNKFRVK